MRHPTFLIAALLPSVLVAAPDPGSRPAREFAAESAQSDAFERAEAAVVLTGSRQADVRAFARRMVADHDRMDRDLGRAAVQDGLAPPPAAMSDDQAHLLAGLQGVSGHDLDVAYAWHQVLGHRSALTVAQGYAAHGDAPALKRAATAAVPVIADHLAAAERLVATLGAS